MTREPDATRIARENRERTRKGAVSAAHGRRCVVAFVRGVLFAFLAGISPLSLAGDDAPKTQPINLVAVMRLAGANNLDIQIAEQRLAEAQAAHEEALMQFFPFVSPGITFRRHEGNVQTVDGAIIDTNKESLGTGVNVTAQMELGETIYKAMIAKRLATAAQFAAEAQRQESVYQAVAAFFELVRAKSARGVAVESVRIADSYAGELGRAVEAGIAFKGDAFRALAQAERNRLVLRQTQEQQRIAAARLAQTLHISPLVELGPEGGEPAPMRLPEYRTGLPALVAQALADRPELRAGDAQLSAARNARDAAKYGPLIPTLRGEYSYGGLGGGTYAEGVRHFSDTSDYGVGLSWRIGPGGLFDMARVRAGNARLQAGELEQAKMREEITRQVVEAHARARSLADQIEFSRRALSAAAQSLKLARERQQFGVGEVLENIQAEQDLTRARLDYLTAITDHNRAQFALQRAVGRVNGGAAQVSHKRDKPDMGL
jgi:outer membrane protein TolC